MQYAYWSSQPLFYSTCPNHVTTLIRNMGKEHVCVCLCVCVCVCVSVNAACTLNSGLAYSVLAIYQSACYSNPKPVARAARTLSPTCASHLMVVHLVGKAAMSACPLGAKHALLHSHELASIYKIYACIQKICMYAFTSKHTRISSLGVITQRQMAEAQSSRAKRWGGNRR